MDLPLHGGSAPRWLFRRMVDLSGAVCEAIVDEHGERKLLERLADPLWFQAFSCVIGFDWHSSGTTTVTCGALREALDAANLGVRIVGGKGSQAGSAASGIGSSADEGFISSSAADSLIRSSRLSAKVDNCAVQDGHRLYHHSMAFDSHGDWTVVQQGLSDAEGYARRYHWCSSTLEDPVNEPHSGVVGSRVDGVLDMTCGENRRARDASVDIAQERRRRVEGLIRTSSLAHQRSLLEFGSGAPQHSFRSYSMPKRIDWDALDRCYEFRPQSYEELLLTKGLGVNLVRALALISQAVYGSPLTWRDPVKFSFAVGGKDGVPFPVDRRSMDRATATLREAVRQSRLGEHDRKAALKRLAKHSFPSPT